MGKRGRWDAGGNETSDLARSSGLLLAFSVELVNLYELAGKSKDPLSGYLAQREPQQLEARKGWKRGRDGKGCASVVLRLGFAADQVHKF